MVVGATIVVVVVVVVGAAVVVVVVGTFVVDGPVIMSNHKQWMLQEHHQ